MPWLCTVISPADAGRSFVNVTCVVWPVGLRIVKPGNEPLYVHRFVQGPGRIGRQAGWMVIPMFDAVATGGKESGFENDSGVPVGVVVGVPVGVRVGVAVEVRVAVGVAVRVAVAVGETAVNVGVGVRVVVGVPVGVRVAV